MSKYDFRPDSVGLIPSLPMLLAVGCISLGSSATLGLGHGFVDRMVCCCFTILASNMWYLVATGLQCLKFQVESVYNQRQRRGIQEQQQKTREALIDDRRLPETNNDVLFITGQYNLTSLLVNTVEFRHTPREVRLFVSRKELWYILYPMAFAVFVLFYCIPMYDISCTVSLVTGLLSKSTYDEVKRGIHWKRGTARKICFTFATVCGIMCASGLFVLGIVVNRQAASAHMYADSNSSVAHLAHVPSGNVSVHAQAIPENMLGTLLHDDGLGPVLNGRRRAQANSTNVSMHGNISLPAQLPAQLPVQLPVQTPAQTPAQTPEEHQEQHQGQNMQEDQPHKESTNISNNAEIDDVSATITEAYNASIQSPKMVQMIILYAVCSYVPFFLHRTPDSIRLPVILEIVQPSISCFAAIVLFAVSISAHGGLVQEGFIYSSGQIAYVCLIPVLVWCVVFFVIKAARTKTTSYVCCIFMLVVYIKILHTTSTFPVKKHGVQQVSIFVGVVCALYILFMTIFIRMENKCIQMGWDSRQDDEDDDFMSSDGMGVNLQNTRQNSPRYSIDDILQRVTHDIKTTEYILSHQNTSSAHAERNTQAPVATEAEKASCDQEHGACDLEDSETSTPIQPYHKQPVVSGLAPIHELTEHDSAASHDVFEGDVENVGLLSSRHMDIQNTHRT